MSTAVGLLNAPFSVLVDLLLAPLRGLSPSIGLAVLALVTSVAILLVFRVTSDQRALRRVKSRIVAGILEIRLFRDDPRSILRSQADIFRESLTYFRLSLVPLVWIILPVGLLLAQLQFRYAYEGPEPGDRTILRVQLDDGFRAGENGEHLALEAPDGVRVETPLLFIPSRNQGLWGVSIAEPGNYELVVRAGDWSVAKQLAAAESVGRRSPRKPSRGLLDQLMYPVESPVPKGSPIVSIEVDYPKARIGLLGWRTHWIVAFFVFTVVFAFALQKPLRVTI